MTPKPLMTMVIPVFNGERFLASAIESVLAQDFDAYELLIVDDGSTDESCEVATSYSDPRVRVLSNDQNRGIPETQNRALAEARGKYFGVLDQDDIACPARISRQVELLEEEREVAAVGAWYRAIDDTGGVTGRIKKTPVEYAEIACSLLFFSAMHQPVVTLRTEVLRRYGYRTRYPVCSDYDLWTRLATDHVVCNLPEVLAYYRQGSHQTSKRAAQRLAKDTIEIQRKLLCRLGLSPTEEDLSKHFGIPRKKRFGIHCDVDDSYLGWLSNWFGELVSGNDRCGIYEPAVLSRILRSYWRRMLIRTAREGSVSSTLRYAIRGSAWWGR